MADKNEDDFLILFVIPVHQYHLMCNKFLKMGVSCTD